MASIAQIVEDIIQHKPFLEAALAKGIINYSKLADDLIDEVKLDPRLSMITVSHSAVMMSLRRLSERLVDEFSHLSSLFSKHLSLEMDYSKFNLFSVTVKRSERVNLKLQGLYDIIDLGHRDYLTMTSGMTEVTIISNARYRDQILSQFDEEEVLEIDNELASISLLIPQDAFQTPGLFYLVTKQLFWDGINIREVVSTLTEMNFILKEIDVPEAMQSLKSLLK